VRKINIFLVLVLAFSVVQPIANAAVADCLQVGSPSASISSGTLRITASVRVGCTNAQIGSGGGAFVYSVVDEGFGARCDGPRSISSGSSGTISCSVSVGPPSGSSRIGATSTTIKIWSAWDFSTKFITASHSSIPTNKESTTPQPTRSPSTQMPTPTPTPTVTPMPTSTPSPTVQPKVINPKKVCISASNYETTCSDYPDWVYSYCSKSSAGQLQMKSRSKWINLWTIKGDRNAGCLPKYPYGIEVAAASKTALGKEFYRINFKKNELTNAWTDTFTATITKKSASELAKAQLENAPKASSSPTSAPIPSVTPSIPTPTPTPIPTPTPPSLSVGRFYAGNDNDDSTWKWIAVEIANASSTQILSHQFYDVLIGDSGGAVVDSSFSLSFPILGPGQKAWYTTTQFNRAPSSQVVFQKKYSTTPSLFSASELPTTSGARLVTSINIPSRKMIAVTVRNNSMSQILSKSSKAFAVLLDSSGTPIYAAWGFLDKAVLPGGSAEVLIGDDFTFNGTPASIVVTIAPLAS